MKNGAHNWKKLPLSEVAKAEWGNTSITKASYVESGFPAFSAAGSDGFLATAEWEGPAVVLSAIGARCGKCFYADGSWTAIKNTIVIQADAPTLSHKFLFYYLNDSTRWKISGSGQPFITLKTVRETKVPLPLLSEQIKAVSEIEKQFTRLDAGVAALRRVQANLKRYRAAVLKAACEGRLVPTEAELARTGQADPNFETGEALLARILKERSQNWHGRGKYKEPPSPDCMNLMALPSGWAWVSVGQLLSEPLCNGISVKGSDNPPGVRALRLSAMSNFGFDYSDARYLPLAESKVDDLWIQSGDFFMSRGNGSLHLVGRGTLAQEPPQPTIFPDTMIRLRLTGAIRKSGWVQMLWPSRVVRSQIEAGVKTTAGIYKIAQPQVEGIAIPLPPLTEQVRIVAEVERRLSVVEELEATLAANFQRAARLRQSTLQQAFIGELLHDEHKQ